MDGLVMARQGRLWTYHSSFSVQISLTAVRPSTGKSAVNRWLTV